MKFSANLGFLWTELPLTDAISAAALAGFDAVEMHWPYETPSSKVKAALKEHNLPLLGLNTRRGDVARGDTGLAAQPGRTDEARAAVDEALDYARATGAGAVHVMAGNGSGPRAHEAFCDTLAYACQNAGDLTVLVEPLNHYDAPGYFLSTTTQAAAIIREIGHANLKLMFDCYHVQIMEGDVSRRLERLLPLIGHIQIAAVPDRGAPDHGELDYRYLLGQIASLGWPTPIGAEYKPGTDTAASLSWMPAMQSI